jgi:hypothetical protein
MRAGPCGTELCVPGWPGAGRVGGLSRAALGAVAGGLRPGGCVRYFLKTSLIFSPACLR